MTNKNFKSGFIDVLKRVALSVALVSGLSIALIPSAGAQTTKPALSSGDLQKVMKWIAQEVSNSRQSYCYRQSYGRGVGVPLSTCTSAQEKDGLLCYPKCQSTYDGVGPVCWQDCPSGFRNDGAFCAKPGPYGRGSGYPWKFGDGMNDHGMYKRCENSHGKGNCEKNGAIVYPKCKAGFHATGCCVCSPNCINGMTDIGVSCAKKSYGRGAGVPMKCKPGEQEDAGLCYNPCKDKYNGVGPVCWQQCPAGRKDCGAGCTTDTFSCVSDTISMVTSPLVLAVNIVTFGSASGATKSATMATKTTKVMDAMKKAEKVYDGVSKVTDTALLIKDVAETTATWVDDYVADFANVTTPKVLAEVNKNFTGAANTWVKRQYAMNHLSLLAKSNGIQTAQTALSAVALFDPTGVAGVIDAFAKPICSTDQAFPTVTRLY